MSDRRGKGRECAQVPKALALCENVADDAGGAHQFLRLCSLRVCGGICGFCGLGIRNTSTAELQVVDECAFLLGVTSWVTTSTLTSTTSSSSSSVTRTVNGYYFYRFSPTQIAQEDSGERAPVQIAL
eukprot:Skav211279  [mRNA]  locus=scaffold2429:94128:99052:+ [translate_table: standard]